MHRDQIRIFPGDVESQVRRLERFGREPAAMSKLGEHGGGEAMLDRMRLLDYSRSRRLSRWQRWLLEGFYSLGLVLLFVLVISIMAMFGSINAVAAIIACVLTPPALWLAMIGLRKLGRRLVDWQFRSQFTFVC